MNENNDELRLKHTSFLKKNRFRKLRVVLAVSGVNITTFEGIIRFRPNFVNCNIITKLRSRHLPHLRSKLSIKIIKLIERERIK